MRAVAADQHVENARCVDHLVFPRDFLSSLGRARVAWGKCGGKVWKWSKARRADTLATCTHVLRRSAGGAVSAFAEAEALDAERRKLGRTLEIGPS